MTDLEALELRIDGPIPAASIRAVMEARLSPARRERCYWLRRARMWRGRQREAEAMLRQCRADCRWEDYEDLLLDAQYYRAKRRRALERAREAK